MSNELLTDTVSCFNELGDGGSPALGPFHLYLMYENDEGYWTVAQCYERKHVTKVVKYKHMFFWEKEYTAVDHFTESRRDFFERCEEKGREELDKIDPDCKGELVAEWSHPNDWTDEAARWMRIKV